MLCPRPRASWMVSTSRPAFLTNSAMSPLWYILLLPLAKAVKYRLVIVRAKAAEEYL